MTRFSWLILAAVAALATGPAAALPRFEPALCRFWVPPGETATCGYVVVPERRDTAQTRDIRLFMAVFHSTAETPARDPVIFVNGGPGDSAFFDDSAEGWWLETEPYRRTRDFVVLDHRGTGRSLPSLDCPELDRIAETLWFDAPSIPDLRLLEAEAANDCRHRLLSEGIDLGAYTTPAIADDILDIVDLFNYPEYNLLALSYGTRVALAIMRRDMARIRSVVLDGVYPPGVVDLMDRPWLVARVFRQLFADCAAQPACNARFPDLESRLLAVLSQLPALPTTGSTGFSTPYRDGPTLLQALYDAFYQTGAVPGLPLTIAEAATGQFDRINLWAGAPFYGGYGLSEGLALSVECSENHPFADRDRLTERIERFAPYGATTAFALEWRACPLWGVSPIDRSEMLPVASDVPALLLAGSYDPVTPPQWAYLAAASLSAATVMEFRAAGHGLSFTEDCAATAAAAFFETPDTNIAERCDYRDRPPLFRLD